MGNFKQLRVWQDALELVTSIYSLSNASPFSRDFGLTDQIRRASVSIPSNIAEGDERGTSKEAIRFFHIAKGSVAEVITQLHVAHNIGYIDQQTLGKLENQSEKIRASLLNLIRARENRMQL